MDRDVVRRIEADVRRFTGCVSALRIDGSDLAWHGDRNLFYLNFALDDGTFRGRFLSHAELNSDLTGIFGVMFPEAREIRDFS